MNRSVNYALALGLALAAMAFPSLAGASQDDRMTFVTFSGPVEIPGRVLPAGKYEFRLLDAGESPDVVQILKADGTQVIATLLTIPRYRDRTPGKTIITFKKPVPGAPEAIRAWYFPGDSDGREFVYPRARAIAIAQASRQPVKATSDNMAAHMSATTPAAQTAAVHALRQAPVQVAQPRGNTVEIVEVAELAPLPQRLPHTATLLPLEFATGSLLLLLGGAALVLRRRAGSAH